MAVFLLLAWATAVGETALLPGLGRCIWGGGGSLSPLDLHRAPLEELSVVPQVDELWWGAVQLGNGQDQVISVVVWEGDGRPHLWVDANNDENMLNDHVSAWDLQGGWECFSWLVDVMVDYREDDVPSPVTVPVVVTAVPNYVGTGPPWYDYIAYAIGYRKGLIQLGGRLRRIAVVDGDWDGIYDPEHVWVYLDTDGDGVICRWCPHELFLPGDPIVMGTTAYQVASISPSGRKLRLEPYEGRFSPRPVLLPGRQLPEWSLTTLQGKEVAISEWRGEVIVLCLLKDTSCYTDDSSSCPTCETGCKRARELGKELRSAFSAEPRYAGRVALLLMLTASSPPPEDWAEEWSGWEVLWAPQLAQALPVWMQSFLVIADKWGVIRYTDQAIAHWDSMGCRGFAPREARSVDVRWAVNRLLAEGR
ncbi:MAG: hypothetical protein ACP5G2_02420 [Candidatus Bipolaricaulaceae bacterium]